ncbi:MAG: exo-alpha-sialidase [Candidatus Poribacteria bacterium]
MKKESYYKSTAIFPYIQKHAHASTIVELSNGDLLSAWFQGSGERQADDVLIMGSRLRKGKDKWSKPFIMADVPGFPDTNPVLFFDTQDRLWLVWYTVIAHQWDTSLLKYRISKNYLKPGGAPIWSWQEVLYVKPGDPAERGIQPNDSFVKSVERQIEEYEIYLRNTSGDQEAIERWKLWGKRMLSKAKGEDMMRKGILYDDKGGYVEQEMGYPYFRRMGWQTKNKAVIVGKRIILPLYSDGFDFSLMAITDDDGETWQFSDPLVGPGNIQPSIAIKSDGTLVAYMRDNGPPPKRLHISMSKDNGMTWSPVGDSEIPNPGSGADVVTLENGHWALVYNDTENGRHSLAVSISVDEGISWIWTRHLEKGNIGEISGAYPSIIEGHDGTLHVVYSFSCRDSHGITQKTIKHANFNEEWVKEGE